MPTYTVSVDIDAEPAEIFPFVADLCRHGGWSADPVEVLAADDTPVAKGKQYRSVAKSKGKTITADLQVTDYVPTSTFGFSVRDLTGEWRHQFTLVAKDGSCRVTRQITGTLTPAQTLLFYLVLPIVKRPNARRALQRLKEQVEEG